MTFLIPEWYFKKTDNKTKKGDTMQFLMLIESLSKIITVDNVESVVSLVEKLAALAESMKSQQPPTPPAQ